MSRPVWVDLAAAGGQNLKVQADVCVIGAGAAGIYMAMQLARSGLSVVVVEAGPAACTDAASIGFEPILEASYYPGATVGRFFGIGGTTSRWGGALVPHTTHDLRVAGTSAGEWSHIIGIVAEKGPAVLRRLGYCKEPDFDSFAERSLGQPSHALSASGIHVQSGIYLPFKRRNLARLLDDCAGWPKVPRVFYNAVAKNWATQIGQSGEMHIAKVVAVSRNNNELTVTAGKFVLAAGAIESARILLEINESGPQPVLRPTRALGCYLADHLSLAIADVLPESLKQTARLFSPRFSGAWMRSFRFLERNPHNGAPRAFAHFIFANRSRGFELAREVLGAMQARRKPSVTMADAVFGLGDLMMLSYDRFARSRLYIPSDTPAHLQLDIEQEAVRENRVSLTNHKDEYGRRVANVRWQLINSDITKFAETARHFLSRWPGKKAGLPELKPKVIDSECAKPYDAYHPVGTCRIGNDIESVVDYNLKVWGLQNLWVASTGVLPSAGTANPTFSMLCLTHKLAEHLQTAH